MTVTGLSCILGRWSRKGFLVWASSTRPKLIKALLHTMAPARVVDSVMDSVMDAWALIPRLFLKLSVISL